MKITPPKSLRKNTRGATMIEYSAVALLILVAGATALRKLGYTSGEANANAASKLK